MRRFLIGLAITAAATLVAASLAGANNRLSPNEEITATGPSAGSLVVSFDEGGLKKFESVEYRLDATGSAIWRLSVDPPQSIGHQYPAADSVTLVPDAKGKVSGTLTLDISQSGSSGCGCSASLERVYYEDVTVTNVTTGRVSVLDPIGQDFPAS
jgi:hypothetical protein